METNIDAIIVAYNPEISLLKNEVKCIARQVDSITIVNNSKEPLKKVVCYTSIHIINLGKNVGIGAAQNIGISKVLETSKEGYFVFFDQDSIIPEDYIKNMIQHIEKLELKNIASYGPIIYNRHDNREYKKSHNTKDYGNFSVVSEIISSGSITPKMSFKTIGLLNEKLFLDYVDFEWCWRARSKGYNIIQLDNIILNHQVGQKSLKIFGTVELVKCAPIRCYIQLKSYSLLLKKKYVPTYWKISNGIKLILMTILFPIIYKERIQYLKYMIKGYSSLLRNLFFSK